MEIRRLALVLGTATVMLFPPMLVESSRPDQAFTVLSSYLPTLDGECLESMFFPSGKFVYVTIIGTAKWPGGGVHELTLVTNVRCDVAGNRKCSAATGGFRALDLAAPTIWGEVVDGSVELTPALGGAFISGQLSVHFEQKFTQVTPKSFDGTITLRNVQAVETSDAQAFLNDRKVLALFPVIEQWRVDPGHPARKADEAQ